MIEYRILDKSEIAKLAPRLQQLGWSLPHPEACTVLVAEEAGEIVGFSVQQVVVHLEPLWVAESHRGTGLADDLALRGAEILKAGGVRAFVSVPITAHSERICRDVLGMKKIGACVYAKTE